MRLLLSLVICFTMSQLSAREEFVSTETIDNSTSELKNTIITNSDNRSTQIRWKAWLLQSDIFLRKRFRFEYADERNHMHWSITDVDLLKITPKLDLASPMDVSSTFKVTELTAPKAALKRFASLVVTGDAIFKISIK